MMKPTNKSLDFRVVRIRAEAVFNHLIALSLKNTMFKEAFLRFRAEVSIIFELQVLLDIFWEANAIFHIRQLWKAIVDMMNIDIWKSRYVFQDLSSTIQKVFDFKATPPLTQVLSPVLRVFLATKPIKNIMQYLNPANGLHLKLEYFLKHLTSGWCVDVRQLFNYKWVLIVYNFR